MAWYDWYAYSRTTASSRTCVWWARTVLVDASHARGAMVATAIATATLAVYAVVGLECSAITLYPGERGSQVGEQIAYPGPLATVNSANRLEPPKTVGQSWIG